MAHFGGPKMGSLKVKSGDLRVQNDAQNSKMTKMPKMPLFGAVGESAKNGIFSRPGSRNEFGQKWG